MRAAFAIALLGACNSHPGHPDQVVEYRVGADGDAHSGERGNVKISEVMWSGSIHDENGWDRSDVFIEIRNEGNRPLNVSGWAIEMEGTVSRTYRFPASDLILEGGQHYFMTAKADGCFPDADWVLPELELPYGDPFYLRLVDADEHLIEAAGNREMLPFSGGYDGVDSRSMEKIELMFGGRGTEPHAWHFYTDAEVEIPNNDRIAEACVTHTKASPGRANSPDYSGAFASGSFE